MSWSVEGVVAGPDCPRGSPPNRVSGRAGNARHN